MFFPEGRIRVFLYGQPADIRKSYDGLYVLARQGFEADALAGHLFVFANRRGTQLKVLYFDRSGWCLWSKRLEAGSFVRKGAPCAAVRSTAPHSSSCSKASRSSVSCGATATSLMGGHARSLWSTGFRHEMQSG